MIFGEDDRCEDVCQPEDPRALQLAAAQAILSDIKMSILRKKDRVHYYEEKLTEDDLYDILKDLQRLHKTLE